MNICIIGYSGHSYVAIETLILSNFIVNSYCDIQKKEYNPFNLNYIGFENDLSSETISNYFFFLGIGNNSARRNIYLNITSKGGLFTRAIHPNAIVSNKSIIGSGSLIVAGAVVNPFSKIGNGVICNSSCVIEHGVDIGNYSHICPGAVICGNVTVGESSLIGAGSVIKPGVIIGSNVTIGAGSLVLSDVPDNTTYVGSPAKSIKK